MDPAQPQNKPQPGTLDAYLEDVERDLLKVIIDNMEHRGMTIDQAHNLAKEFLAILPPADKQDLLQKLTGYTTAHPEAKMIADNFRKLYEISRDQETLEKMRQHIQSGNIEQAIMVAKGGDN